MRRPLTLAALIAAAVLAPASASSGATPAESQALRAAVNADGAAQHMAALQQIADENDGTRASGTPGYDESLMYVKDQLEATGYFDVAVQPFLFDVFIEGEPGELEQLSPDPATYSDVDTMEYSKAGEVTGQLVAVNDIVIPPGADANTSTAGCEPGDFVPASETETQIALIQRGTCSFQQKAENAAAAGYDAAVIFNEGQPGRDGTVFGTLSAEYNQAIPVVGTSFAVGEGLYSQLQEGDTVVMRVFTDGETRTDQPTANLIATTKSGRTDRQVVVGAHLDSVFDGPGINDNGSGSSHNLEIALQMAELGVQPRNQVAFAWWGAEESGLIGSQYYVDQLSKRQIKNIAVNLNFDMVASPNYVRFVYDGDASDTASTGSAGSGVVEDVFNDYFASQGLATEPTAFDGRSDYDAFVAVGIPAGGTFTGAEGIKTLEQVAVYGGVAGEQYDPCYHAACDTYDSVFNHPPGLPLLQGNGKKALEEMIDGGAHATLVFAQSTSAVQGTDKGKANGRSDAEFLGSHLRR